AAELMTDRLRILASIDAIGHPVVLDGADGPSINGPSVNGPRVDVPSINVPSIVVYGIPYLDPDAVRARLADDDGGIPGRSHAAVLSAAMDIVRADLARRPAGTVAVAMAHAFVTGG